MKTKEETIERLKYLARYMNLEDACKEMLVDKKYYSRIFKEEVGQRYTDYRLSLQMIDARELLKSYKTIIEISKEFKYKCPESFTRTFTKLVGVSPTNFRAKIKKNS